MEKTKKIYLIICTVLVTLILCTAVTVKVINKYSWQIKIYLYGSKEAQKQEFLYHGTDILKKDIGLSSQDTPNVILISLDTLRAQSMTTYGFDKKTSPYMDSLAREGVLFENMCATATSTPPSHMSMMTGLYLGVHGVLNEQILSANIKTLPEYLSDAGYATGAVTENGFLIRQMGFGRGFDDYFEIKDTELFEQLLVTGGFAKDVFIKGEAWIREKADQRFFLFLHTYEVHTPYFPPEPYNTAFLDNPEKHEKAFKKLKKYKGRIGSRKFSPEFLRSQYEGEIKYVDDLVNDLITFLKENNLDRKTLIIITSDHGEDLFEHMDANGKTIVGHGNYAYNTESHVPFLLWMPGKIPSGLRIPYQASLVDILPTISDFLNLTVPDDIQGESLMPVIHSQDYSKERFVFCEANKQVCVKSKKFKYLKHIKKNIQELFLYADDPFEESNRIKEEPALAAKAEQLFSDFNANCESLKIAKGLMKTEKTVDLDDEDLKKLKALGYIE